MQPHLAAGIAGGVVALLAADMLASQLNLSGPADREDATEETLGLMMAGVKGEGAA